MIQFEIRDLDVLRQIYDPKVVDRALNAAINKTTNKARTQISRRVREKYNVKAKDIANALHEVRHKNPLMERVLIYTGARLSLMYFDPKEVRVTKRGAITTKRSKGALVASRSKRVSKRHRELVGVSVLVKKSNGRKTVKGEKGYGAFMAQGRRGQSGGGWSRKLFNRSNRKAGRGNVQIFMREGDKRLPIERRTSLSIPMMIGNKEDLIKLNELVQREMSVEFDRAMSHFLDKAGAR